MNNKAFKSRMRLDPNCERCGKVDTMEHLLCECEYYSGPLWSKLEESLTMLFNDISPNRGPRVELGQDNIIFNIPHPSLLLHAHDKTSKNAILLMIQCVGDTHIGAVSSGETDLHIKSSTDPPTSRDPPPLQPPVGGL